MCLLCLGLLQQLCFSNLLSQSVNGPNQDMQLMVALRLSSRSLRTELRLALFAFMVSLLQCLQHFIVLPLPLRNHR